MADGVPCDTEDQEERMCVPDSGSTDGRRQLRQELPDAPFTFLSADFLSPRK